VINEVGKERNTYVLDSVAGNNGDLVARLERLAQVGWDNLVVHIQLAVPTQRFDIDLAVLWKTVR
jgi:hypothetical protein